MSNLYIVNTCVISGIQIIVCHNDTYALSVMDITAGWQELSWEKRHKESTWLSTVLGLILIVLIFMQKLGVQI